MSCVSKHWNHSKHPLLFYCGMLLLVPYTSDRVERRDAAAFSGAANSDRGIDADAAGNNRQETGVGLQRMTTVAWPSLMRSQTAAGLCRKQSFVRIHWRRAYAACPRGFLLKRLDSGMAGVSIVFACCCFLLSKIPSPASKFINLNNVVMSEWFRRGGASQCSEGRMPPCWH